MKNLSLFLTCTFGILTFQVDAQDSLNHHSKEVFVGVGMASYNGDLGDGYQSGSLLGVVGIKLNNKKKLNSNFNITFGQISGQELDYAFEPNPSATPNTYFSSSFISFNYDLQFNFIDLPKLKVYLSQGVGLMRYEAKDQFSNSLLDQTNTRAVGEEYRNLTVVLPTQLGFKYKLPNDFGLGLQAGFYNTMTDYIDNISQWGNKEGNDNIFSIRFQLSVPLN
ncbi:MAG: hypothetical protein JXR07_03080 [Reichenbachiella sp.]